MTKFYVMNGAFYSSVLSLVRGWGYELAPPTEATALVLVGGEDIHPTLYGHPNVASWCGKEPSKRDKDEVEMFRWAVDKGIPILGICRGAQLGCALSGGWLVQDLSHKGDHDLVDTRTGQIIPSSTSIHHQMIQPGPHGVVLATHTTHTTRTSYFGSVTSTEDDPEIIWYPNTKTLCVQGHPECGPSIFSDYVHKLWKEHTCAD